MAHFAQISNDSFVLRVVVIPDTQEERGEEYLAHDLKMGGKWVQCSYNGRIRNQFPGVGSYYLEERDVFISQKPYPSWTLTAENKLIPPIKMPDDKKFQWKWDEEIQKWSIRVFDFDFDIENLNLFSEYTFQDHMAPIKIIDTIFKDVEINDIIVTDFNKLPVSFETTVKITQGSI